jgi:DNA polymerase III delta subunit
MITVYTGTDMMEARREAQGAVASLRSESPSSTLSSFDDLSFSFEQAMEEFHTENLFGGQNILYFEGILEHPEGELFYRTVLSETPKMIIVVECDIPKDLLVFFERVGVVRSFAERTVARVERFNSFAVVDALIARDKKSAWVEYVRGVRRKEVPEAVHGQFFWAFRSLYVIATNSREEALACGVKEYTYSKNRAALARWTVEEIRTRLDMLKDMYHDAHEGKVELPDALERFILGL